MRTSQISKCHLCYFLLLLMILPASCSDPEPKYFEGTIKYSYTYTSDSLDADSLAEVRDRRSEFYYKDDNYKSVFYGPSVKEYIYLGGPGLGYYREGNSLTYELEDYKVFTDSVLSINATEKGDTVLGHPCRLIELEGKYFSSEFHCAKDLTVPPGSYALHNAYNWKFLMDKAQGGIVLKATHHFRHFDMHSLATDIRREIVPDSVFAMDK